MAVTQNTYTGNGSTVLFSFTFPYLDTSHIQVEVSGAATTAYTLANATTIQFNTAPANGASIRIYRKTTDTQLLSTFFSGSAIRAQDLNEDFNQSLYIAQETRNETANAVAGQIADGSIGTSKIADNSVTTAKIADGTIVNADVNASAGIVASKLSFTQAGTGAVARTIDSKLKDVVSVKDFGAVGDGVTNDTAAIQAAADYCVANQRSLHFPAGFYLVRQRIRFTGAANIAITGEGLCNSRIHLYSLTGTDAGAAVSISDNAAQVTVRGLYFTVDQNSISRNCCLGIEKASSIFITDCFFGGALYNLNLRGVIDSGIDNCSFENASNSGILFDDNTGNIWSPSNPSIWTFGTARVSVNNCIIVTNGGGTNNSNAFTFNGVTLTKALQTIFTGCQFYGNTDTNAYLLAAQDTHFIGCHFGDPVGGSSDKTFIIVNNSSARLYLTGCNFGDGNVGATPIRDIINLGYVAGTAEAHIVNCKINATPTRNIVYDDGGGGTLKTWLGGAAPISSLPGVKWAVCNDGRWLWSDNANKLYYKHGRPASTTDGTVFAGGLEASATYDPPNLADGAGTTTTVTCTGAALGDMASASFSLDLQGITVTAWVSATNTVSVRFQNESGGALDLGSGTLRVRVAKA